jgi:hypothetical protein
MKLRYKCVKDSIIHFRNGKESLVVNKYETILGEHTKGIIITSKEYNLFHDRENYRTML